METTRLFLALWPGPAVREELRAWRDEWQWPRGASPVADDKLHLTLHFLGSQPSERVAELADGLAVECAPFRVELGVPVVWPGGIAVLEPYSTPPELLRLHADLSDALVRLGLVPEARPYRPHATMARRAGGAVAPADGRKLMWDVAGYALVESQPGGYAVVKVYS
jgi:RNA 2',3'-cyclic 3'-phosphodiesterase